jgi:ABC-2 type transport system permease protein
MKKNHKYFSFFRLWSVMRKEFILMRRDRFTFAILLVIPLMQLLLFGYAINTNPKYLPTAVVTTDNNPFTRAFLAGLVNTQYFAITKTPKTTKEADNMLAKGEVQFVVTIPSDFARNLVRNDHPQIDIDADATDPVATSSALGAVQPLLQTVFNPLLVGNLRSLQPQPPPVDVVLHAKYNPEAITSYNIVPGLLGVVLTMTMVMSTCLSITKEREIGTMESLLATPVRPLEVMIGKIAPQLIVGYTQVSIILLAAVFLFHVPIFGSVLLLLLAALPFIAANLSVGVAFSSAAQNQMQAVQMTMFFFLPSIMLSGFMFPFRGMPQWAQWVGSILPLTHFLRIARGIMLKGNGLEQIWPDVWPILIFMVVVILIGVKVYRRTLD